MLDYAQLGAKDLQAAVKAITSTIPIKSKIYVAELNDCYLMVNASAVQQLGSLNDLQLPLFVLFTAASNGTMAPRWCTPTEQSDILSRLRKEVCEPLDMACADGQSIPLVKLDGHLRELTAPAAYGFILGYPAIYVVESADHAQAVSRCLSCTTLRFHSVLLELESSSALEGLKSLSGKKEGSGVLPMSFSLPVELEREATWPWEDHKRVWMEGLRQRQAAAAAAGVPIKQVKLSQVSEMRGIMI